MPLAPGTQVGRFEIIDPLGAGGMGEVYRALDTRLGRRIALKILRASLAEDTGQIARLRQEARLLASLTHPNIAALYDLEHADERWFLVMELADGSTLAELIAGARGSAEPARAGSGPEPAAAETGTYGLPIQEALRLAVQMTEALDAAHMAGVVHCDLKPANIKVSPQGHVKVLDFGIARALARVDDDGATRALPAGELMDLTSSTGILGTPAYMSPEQASGLAVDKRTDIWAFGCCLYEVLTGRCPFGAPTIDETIAAILRTEPDWDPLPAVTPAPIRTLIKRCLTKEPRRRLRDIGDARLELEDVLAALGDVRAAGAAGRSADFKTVLVSRVVDLAALSERMGVAAANHLLARHDALFRDCLSRWGGLEIDRAADRFIAMFTLPSDAVLCALRLQQRIAALDPAVPLRIAIGIHAGEVSQHRGMLLADPAIDAAMRLAQLAQPGQVLLTEAADSARLDLTRTPDATPIVWLDHGAYVFRGIESPLAVIEAGVIGLSALSRPPDIDTVTRAPAARLSMPPVYKPRKK